MDFDQRFKSAELHRQSGQLVEAYKSYSDLLKDRISVVGSSGSFHSGDAVLMERLSDLSQLFRQDEASSDFLSALEQIYAGAGNGFAQTYIVLKQVNLFLNKPDVQAAFALLVEKLGPLIGDPRKIEISENGLRLWETSCRLPANSADEQSFLWTWICFVMGRILLRLGQYNNAIVNFKRGVQHAKNNGYGLSDYWQSMLMLNYAIALIEMGKAHEADEVLKKIKSSGETRIVSGLHIQILESEAKLNYITGQLGQSYRLYNKAFSFYLKYQLPDALFTALTNLIQIKILLNQVFDAEQLIIVAQTLIGDDPSKEQIETIKLLKFLAQERRKSVSSPIDIAQKAPSPTSGTMLLAPEVFAKEIRYSDGYLPAFEHRALAFQIHLSNQNLEAAAQSLKHIKQVFANTDSPLIQQRVKILECYFTHFSHPGSINKALALTVLEFLDKWELRLDLWQFKRVLIYDGIFEGNELETAIEENKVLLRQIAGTLSVGDAAVFMLNKWEEGELALANDVDKIIKESVKGGVLNFIWNLLFSKKRKIKEALQNLVSDIDIYKDTSLQREVFLASTRTPKKNVQRLLESHPDTVLTIRFLVLPDRIISVFYTKNFIDFRVVYISRIDLRQIVKKLHVQSSNNQGIRGTGFTNDDEEPTGAFEELIAEVCEYLCIEDILSDIPKTIKSLKWIPDDILCGFPFAMLRFRDAPLVERFAMTVAYDDDFLHSEEKQVVRNIAFVGVTQSVRQLSSLPGALAEIDALASTEPLSKATKRKYLDNEIRKSLVVKSFFEEDLLHIACHGFFDHSQVLASGLILSEAETLSIKEILSFEERPTLKHITLSSCWAADQFVTPNRWIFSLPHALRRSGIPSVLGCLWEVNDAVSVYFMASFYAFLQDHPSDVALQLTQQKALNNLLIPNVDTSNPFFWSGYVLHGQGVSLFAGQG